MNLLFIWPRPTHIWLFKFLTSHAYLKKFFESTSRCIFHFFRWLHIWLFIYFTYPIFYILSILLFKYLSIWIFEYCYILSFVYLYIPIIRYVYVFNVDLINMIFLIYWLILFYFQGTFKILNSPIWKIDNLLLV